MIRVDINNLERTLAQIVEAIDRLDKAVNKPSTKERKPTAEEKIRVVEQQNGKYKVEFKTDKGWITSDNSEATGFKIKN